MWHEPPLLIHIFIGADYSEDNKNLLSKLDQGITSLNKDIADCVKLNGKELK